MPRTTTKGKNSSKSKAARQSTPQKKSPASQGERSVLREGGAVFFLILALFSIIGYFSANGVFISLFSGLMKGLLGWGYYAVPPLFLLCAVILGFHRGKPVRLRIVCTLLLSVSLAALFHLVFSAKAYAISLGMVVDLWHNGQDLRSGGALGGSLSEIFSFLFSRIGACLVFISVSTFFLLASLNRTIAGIVDTLKQRRRRLAAASAQPMQAREPVSPPVKPAPAVAADFLRGPKDSAGRNSRRIDIPLDEPEHVTTAEPLRPNKNRASLFNDKPRVKTPDELLSPPPQEKDAEIRPEPVEQVKAEKAPEKPAEKSPEKGPDLTEPSKTAPKVHTEPDDTQYAYPSLELLQANTSGRVDGTDEARLNSERLEAAFKSFGVHVKILSFTRGPSVTRYEAELEAGIKLNRLTSLADDIALSLGANGVRIAAMPNKISTVGIEVPNKLISKVLLRDIIDSQEFRNASSRLTFAIGKNIGGEAIVGDIAKLPHMLVAGTTGSGKSVCLNSLILSILFKSTPNEVRFIMIDPKMVEFRVYNGIPHLLVPVVTDVKKAAGALQWAVVEMMKRYRTFSEANARDLESYNKLIKATEGGETLPQIVVIIDELADLMLTAAKEVEESICRVAQMGRAAGVHLIIATQSPRADVITGLMKANIPSRIALKVSSALESRIILDAGGNADKLVGNGDMLYAPIGASKPIRIQGTWVSDSEREQVVDFVKKSGETQYNEEVIHQIDKAAVEKSGGSKKDDQEETAADYDELLPQAVEIIFETGQASVSMLQRRLKLGYSRAARIIDQMEQLKIVGPFEGSKPRQMLVDRAGWHEMQFLRGTAPIGVLPELEAEIGGDNG